MKRFSVTAAFVLAVFLATGSCPAAADGSSLTAAQTVQDAVERVRITVKEKEASVSAEQLDLELRGIIKPVFDFREMSKRCLGINWRKGTAEQQAEFVELFSELLAKNYLKKIRENVADSQFSISGENSRGAKALVRTKVNYDDQEVAIDYRLYQQDNAWKVYDVVVENIGLVSNYRNEFAGIIAKEEFSGLLVRLREKTK